MSDDDIFNSILVGLAIGGGLGLIGCISICEIGGNRATWAFIPALGSVLAFATLGGLIAPIVQHYRIREKNGLRNSTIDISDALLAGAVYGAFIGFMVCNFRCMAQGPTGSDFFSIFGWGTIKVPIFGVVGALTALPIRFFLNEETNRINEENRANEERERKRQELERWKDTRKIQIDSLFKGV